MNNEHPKRLFQVEKKSAVIAALSDALREARHIALNYPNGAAVEICNMIQKKIGEVQ
jgi:hypothetical protein